VQIAIGRFQTLSAIAAGNVIQLRNGGPLALMSLVEQFQYCRNPTLPEPVLRFDVSRRNDSAP